MAATAPAQYQAGQHVQLPDGSHATVLAQRGRTLWLTGPPPPGHPRHPRTARTDHVTPSIHNPTEETARPR